MNLAAKRKREAAEPDSKKVKAPLGDRERELFAQSSEWPVYNHPDGGTVKITPWGSLRQYTNDAGETVTRFEDVSFNDYSFAMSPGNFSNQCYDMPTTPMSLSMSTRSSPVPERMFSPTCDAEQYVVEGYSRPQQYAQEQENYFGMENDHEEYLDVLNESLDEDAMV